MTRINSDIQPVRLCDQHLLSEHREIIRARHMQKSRTKPPAKFVLGTGHVMFFKDKLGFIYSRYLKLYAECKRRGFEVEDYRSCFNGFDLSGQWEATDESMGLIVNRINERLDTMQEIRYMGKVISNSQAVNILLFNPTYPIHSVRGIRFGAIG